MKRKTSKQQTTPNEIVVDFYGSRHRLTYGRVFNVLVIAGTVDDDVYRMLTGREPKTARTGS